MPYVDVKYADEYVSTHFLTTDSLRISWESLLDEDKEILLTRSFDAIECLPYVGCKSDPKQTTAFPRCPSDEVPEAVKNAQVENAVSLADSSTSEDQAFYEKLWQFGVESYSIGNLSEKTSSGAWGRSTGSATSGIVSARATQLLQPYLRGGYQIRGSRP